MISPRDRSLHHGLYSPGAGFIVPADDNVWIRSLPHAYCTVARKAGLPCTIPLPPPAGRGRHKGGQVSTKYFGASVRRVEDPRLLRGNGRFVDDIKLPGLLHAALVRSPHAHARI